MSESEGSSHANGMMLGRLLSQGDEHGRQLEAMFKQVDAMRREVAETAGIAKEALRLATETARDIQADIMPTVKDYTNLKAKGLGVLGVIAIMGGGAATAITKFWNTLTGPP